MVWTLEVHGIVQVEFFCSIPPRISLGKNGLLAILMKRLLNSLTGAAIFLLQAKGLDKQFTPITDLPKVPFFSVT